MTSSVSCIGSRRFCRNASMGSGLEQKNRQQKQPLPVPGTDARTQQPPSEGTVDGGCCAINRSGQTAWYLNRTIQNVIDIRIRHTKESASGRPSPAARVVIPQRMRPEARRVVAPVQPGDNAAQAPLGLNAVGTTAFIARRFDRPGSMIGTPLGALVLTPRSGQ